jgi:hypothetical protein
VDQSLDNPQDDPIQEDNQEEEHSTAEQKAFAERVQVFPYEDITCHYYYNVVLDKLHFALNRKKDLAEDLADTRANIAKRDKEIAGLKGQIEVYKTIVKDNQSLVQGVIQTTSQTTAAATARPSFKRARTEAPKGKCRTCHYNGKDIDWVECLVHNRQLAKKTPAV